MLPEDIENRFSYHAPTTGNIALHEEVRLWAKHFAVYLNDTLPESREKSLAFASLEEVVFWSNASIARNIKE